VFSKQSWEKLKERKTEAAADGKEEKGKTFAHSFSIPASSHSGSQGGLEPIQAAI